MTIKRQNMEPPVTEDTVPTAPPATWTSTERDPDTGLMKEPKKSEEASDVTTE
jgi:hypothetical protein